MTCTQPDGARYLAEYDRLPPTGRITCSYAEADGRSLRFVYDYRDRTSQITDSLGRTSCYLASRAETLTAAPHNRRHLRFSARRIPAAVA
jgi:YD repeat-containing protein